MIDQLTANDALSDASTLLITAAPTFGTVEVAADLTVEYTPTLDFNGIDAFQYTLVGSAGSDSARCTGQMSSVPPARSMREGVRARTGFTRES